MKIPQIKKLPSGQYRCQLRLNGRSYSITGDSRKEVEIQATLLKTNYRADKTIYEKPRLPLRMAIDMYIENRSSSLSPSTIRGYRIVQKNRFQDYMDRDIFSRIDWQQMIRSEEAAGSSTKTIRNAWGLVSSVLRENGIQVPSVSIKDSPRKERPWLTPEQIPVFLELIRDHPCELPALLALHSLRMSEILDLTMEDIDLEARTISVTGTAVPDENGNLVHKSATKTKASRRTIPIMIPRAYDLLEAKKGSSGYLFNLKGNSISESISRLCSKNGLPPVGSHGLRHSFASLAYHLGLSEMETMSIGGWSDFSTMRKIYTHLSDQDRLRSTNLMADFYQGR